MTSTFTWFVLVVDGDDVWLHLNSSVLTIQTVHIYTNRVRDSILHNFWRLGNGKVDYYETVQYCLQWIISGSGFWLLLQCLCSRFFWTY